MFTAFLLAASLFTGCDSSKNVKTGDSNPEEKSGDQSGDQSESKSGDQSDGKSGDQSESKSGDQAGDFSGKQGKTALVFDTDAGTDDAAAFLLLKKLGIQPDFIVATGGNAFAEGALRNTIILNHYLDLSAEIARGDEKELSNESNTFHGPDGFAGISTQMIDEYHISDEELNNYTSLPDFAEALKEYDQIDYIAVGPLTTLAYLCKDETINGKLNNIYLMGGGIQEFNCSHDTEFNFSKNPEADVTVLSSGHTIVLFTLDLTNHQRLTSDQIDTLEKTGNLPEYIALLRYNHQANAQYDNIDAAVLHDTMPVLYYAGKDRFETEKVNITCDEYGHIEIAEEGYPITYVKSVQENLLFDEMLEAFNTVKSVNK